MESRARRSTVAAGSDRARDRWTGAGWDREAGTGGAPRCRDSRRGSATSRRSPEIAGGGHRQAEEHVGGSGGVRTATEQRICRRTRRRDEVVDVDSELESAISSVEGVQRGKEKFMMALVFLGASGVDGATAIFTRRRRRFQENPLCFFRGEGESERRR